MIDMNKIDHKEYEHWITTSVAKIDVEEMLDGMLEAFLENNPEEAKKIGDD